MEVDLEERGTRGGDRLGERGLDGAHVVEADSAPHVEQQMGAREAHAILLDVVRARRFGLGPTRVFNHSFVRHGRPPCLFMVTRSGCVVWRKTAENARLLRGHRALPGTARGAPGAGARGHRHEGGNDGTAPTDAGENRGDGLRARPRARARGHRLLRRADRRERDPKLRRARRAARRHAAGHVPAHTRLPPGRERGPAPCLVRKRRASRARPRASSRGAPSRSRTMCASPACR